MNHNRLVQLDRQFLLHPLHQKEAVDAPRIWARGEGPFLFDVEGNRFLDGVSGLWNVLVGHGQGELIEAARQQASELEFCSSFAGNTNPRSIELAEKLAGLVYPGINKFFFTSGGGEATDSSIKAARYYWKLQGKPEKTKTISLKWGYHGLTLAGMSATGIDSYWDAFEPRVPGFIHIPSHDPYRYVPPPGMDPGLAAANELEQAILREGAETVALFIAEPVTGAGGIIVPPDSYFPRIREICDQYDVLLVSDEIITGFGRTGKMFGLEHWGIEPDILQFAKGITSGYFPLGGIGLSDPVASVIEAADSPFLHAYTYNGHPVGCAVALANIALIQREGLVEQAAEKGRHLMDRLQNAFTAHPHAGDLRGKGLMCAVEFVANRETKASFAAEKKIGARIHAETQKRGLFSRVRGDSFFLAPPLTTDFTELDRVVDVLVESTTEILGR